MAVCLVEHDRRLQWVGACASNHKQASAGLSALADWIVLPIGFFLKHFPLCCSAVPATAPMQYKPRQGPISSLDHPPPLVLLLLLLPQAAQGDL